MIAVAVSYLLTVFVSPLLKPGYDWVSQYVSELGATGTPEAALISYGGFLSFGLLAAMLIISLRDRVPLEGAARVGYWLLLCEPIAWIGSALAPCDPGCPIEGSPSQVVHNALGILTYLGTAVALFLIAGSRRIAPRLRVLWTVLGVFWLAMFIAMGMPDSSPWRGLFQRLGEWALYPALLVAAWHLAGREPSASRSYD